MIYLFDMANSTILIFNKQYDIIKIFIRLIFIRIRTFCRLSSNTLSLLNINYFIFLLFLLYFFSEYFFIQSIMSNIWLIERIILVFIRTSYLFSSKILILINIEWILFFNNWINDLHYHLVTSLFISLNQ